MKFERYDLPRLRRRTRTFTSISNLNHFIRRAALFWGAIPLPVRFPRRMTHLQWLTLCAGQFQVINGQLVQLLANGGQLYGSVESRADSTVMKLRVSFVKTAPSASAGTFQWSGDALQWTISSISRPNLSAWLACPDSAGNVALYVNLGSYGYQTPAGCYDHTIHFYNAATASS